VTMGANGYVTPNHALGGVTVNFYGPVLGAARQVAEEIGPEIMRWSRRQGVTA